MSHDPGLPGARPCDDQQRSLDVQYRLPLAWIEGVRHAYALMKIRRASMPPTVTR